MGDGTGNPRWGVSHIFKHTLLPTVPGFHLEMGQPKEMVLERWAPRGMSNLARRTLGGQIPGHGETQNWVSPISAPFAAFLATGAMAS